MANEFANREQQQAWDRALAMEMARKQGGERSFAEVVDDKAMEWLSAAKGATDMVSPIHSLPAMAEASGLAPRWREMLDRRLSEADLSPGVELGARTMALGVGGGQEQLEQFGQSSRGRQGLESWQDKLGETGTAAAMGLAQQVPSMFATAAGGAVSANMGAMRSARQLDDVAGQALKVQGRQDLIRHVDRLTAPDDRIARKLNKLNPPPELPTHNAPVRDAMSEAADRIRALQREGLWDSKWDEMGLDDTLKRFAGKKAVDVGQVRRSKTGTGI